MQSLELALKSLIAQDKFRVDILSCVSELDLPQCYVAAGFIRNLVWDYLHKNPFPTPLNDIDVVYFDPNEKDSKANLIYQARLTTKLPNLNWQVKNQASMHINNGDQPYLSTLDAMAHWPEKETAVAAKLISDKIEVVSAFGLESLFALKVTPNPKRSRDLFEQRVKSKAWLKAWPLLTLN